MVFYFFQTQADYKNSNRLFLAAARTDKSQCPTPFEFVPEGGSPAIGKAPPCPPMLTPLTSAGPPPAKQRKVLQPTPKCHAPKPAGVAAPKLGGVATPKPAGLPTPKPAGVPTSKPAGVPASKPAGVPPTPPVQVAPPAATTGPFAPMPNAPSSVVSAADMQAILEAEEPGQTVYICTYTRTLIKNRNIK